MLDQTFIYPTTNGDVTIHGFLAFLLQQGKDWDFCCLEADARDYHAQQYARIHPTIALQQELQWWLDFVHNELLDTIPSHDELIDAGLIYLQWRVHEQLTPLSDAEKLNTEMSIHIDEYRGICKVDNALGIFDHRTEDAPQIIHGFPAQLLTYAACTTIDMHIQQMDRIDSLEWVDCMFGFLQSPATIMLRYIRFDIPNVYSLYESYLVSAKAEWDDNNRRHYQSGKPKSRYFMPRLLEQTQFETEEALRHLSEYLSAEQFASFSRYLYECQQYIRDRITTKRKERSDELSQFYRPNVYGKSRHLITRRLHEAATHPTNPAAELARVVNKMQSQRVLSANIRPHTHFIAVINKTFGTNIKCDSFSKHFRNC